jgi:hypothetical protein
VLGRGDEVNNQVKLTDTKKLEEWLSERMQYAGGCDERFYAFEEVLEELRSGEFAASPPVPTIKPGDRIQHDKFGRGTVTLGPITQALVIVDFDTYLHHKSVDACDLEVVE